MEMCLLLNLLVIVGLIFACINQYLIGDIIKMKTERINKNIERIWTRMDDEGKNKSKCSCQNISKKE